MVTLEEFYHSKKWEKLILFIKLERTRKDGNLYCEHCGEPITKAYDCIGHHIEELDENNVNDSEIALNPDNVMLVHHKCHNKIHNKLGYSNRQVFLVYGSPLSGKSTWVDSVIVPGDLVIDMDNIWECISGMERYVKPGRLNAVAFHVRNALMDAVRTRMGRWQNAYIIGGYPYISERERICKTFGAREILIDTDKETCMRRLRSAEDGRKTDEWEKYIEDWWRKYAPGQTKN